MNTPTMLTTNSCSMLSSDFHTVCTTVQPTILRLAMPLDLYCVLLSSVRLSHPQFPDSKLKVEPLAEVPLGVAGFKHAFRLTWTTEVTRSRFKAQVPDLPAAHHLACDPPNRMMSKMLYSQLDIVHDIVKFWSSPKRYQLQDKRPTSRFLSNQWIMWQSKAGFPLTVT
jgi:hypothetical protein